MKMKNIKKIFLVILFATIFVTVISATTNTTSAQTPIQDGKSYSSPLNSVLNLLNKVKINENSSFNLKKTDGYEDGNKIISLLLKIKIWLVNAWNKINDWMTREIGINIKDILKVIVEVVLWILEFVLNLLKKLIP